MKRIGTVRVAFRLPESVPHLLSVAQAVLNGVAANKALFPKPNPPLAQIQSHIDALNDAEVATKTRASNTFPLRDTRRLAVAQDMRELKAYVEHCANANLDQCGEIAQRALMALHKSRVVTKEELMVKQLLERSVALIAKAVKGGKAHEWQYSVDKTTWIPIPATLQGKTTLSGLDHGLMYFRHRAITKAGPERWSQVVSFFVV